MSRGREYRTGLIITGDASGGIRAIKATEGELGKLNTRFDSSSRHSQQLGNDAVRTGRQLKEIDRGATDASRGLSLVQRAATLAMAAFSIRQLGAYADGWSDLNSRILNTTKDVELSDHTLQRLAETARGTYSSLNQTAEAYLNNATTLTELGYSTERQLDLSDALNNALVISATRGQQAESVMNALSKSFAAGELRGDNFNTVIQSGGRIAEALAAGLGVATIELREMAAAGELTTARVFDALTSQMQVLRQEAEDMPATIADGWTLIGNASMELVGRMDRAAGASERVATLMIGAADGITASIDPLIDNLDTLQDAATLAAAVVAGRYAGAFATATTSMIAKTLATRADIVAEAEAAAAAARRTAAERQTALALLNTAQLEVQATRGTAAHTFALQQLSVARTRAATAAGAHSVATAASTAAMERASLAAQGLALAGRAASGALAMVGGPLGVATIAATAFFLFRDSSDDVATSLVNLDEPLETTIENFRTLTAESQQAALIRWGDRQEEEADKARKALASIREELLSLGFENSTGAQAREFFDEVNAGFDAVEAGAQSLDGMLNRLQDQLEIPDSVMRDLRLLAAEYSSGRIAADEMGRRLDVLTATYHDVGAAAETAGRRVNSNTPSAQALEEWEKYNQKIRDSIAALNDPSALGAVSRDLDAMGITGRFRRSLTMISAMELERLKEQEERQKQAASAAKQAASEAERAYRQQARAAEQAAKQQADALRSIQHEMNPLLAEHATYIERLGVLDKALADGTLTQEAYGETVRWAATQYARAATGADDYEKQTASLVSTYDRHNQRARELQNALRDIGDRYRAGVYSAEQYTRMVAGVREEMRQLAEEADPLSKDLARSWEEAGNRIDQTFSDGFTGALDSFNDFEKQLLSGFKRLLGELLYQATARPIVVAFTTDMRGMMSGGGGGFGNTLGAARSLFSSGSSLLGGGAAAGGLYASANTGAAAGGLYGNIATSAATSTGIMSSITAGVSAAMPWIAGGLALDSLLGGGITKAIGGLFSNKKTFDFDFLQGQHSYVFGDGTSALGDYGLTRLTDYKLGEEQNQLKEMLAALGAFDNEIAAAALPERFDAISAAIHGFAHSGAENLFETRLRAMISGGEVWAAEAVASITDPEKLAQGMLGALQLERIGNVLGAELSAEIQQAVGAARGDYAADVVNSVLAQAQAADVLYGAASRLNLQFDVTAQGALAAAGSLADYVGGLDSLAAIQQGYYQAAYSETERLSTAQTELLATLASVTDQAPRTVEELRALVEAQDLNGEASQRLAYDLMALAPALAETNAAVRQAIEAQYQDALGRGPAGDELEYWFQQVATGALSLEGALFHVAESAEAAEFAAGNAAAGLEGVSNVLREREQLMRQILQLEGREAELRQMEIDSRDESNRALQQRIHALQDEQAAQQAAERAQQERIRAIERESQAWARARDQLSSFGSSISGWVSQLDSSETGGGSPRQRLESSDADFWAQYQKALGGDRNAQQSITQYADRYIDNLQQMYASGASAQAGIAEVRDAMNRLPELLSPEQFLAEEFRGIVEDQTGALVSATDLNGDGTVSALERAIAANWGAGELLKNVLHQEMRRLGSTLLTESQVRAALSPIATDAEIDRLLRRVDANGDGMISQQELTVARMGSLATGIASALAPEFSTLDSNLDSKLTFSELQKGLAGMATDAELRNLIAMVDLNGDGQISKIEALISESKTGSELLKTALSSEFGRLGATVLTESQVIAALKPHATDAEISRLISRVDVNGDGMISVQELTNARIGGLAGGIANAVAGEFSSIDISGDGLIDYDEFRKAFQGMATDSELRRIFAKLDSNGSGTLSRLDAQTGELKTAAKSRDLSASEQSIVRALNAQQTESVVRWWGHHIANEFERKFSGQRGLGVSLSAWQSYNGVDYIARWNATRMLSGENVDFMGHRIANQLKRAGVGNGGTPYYDGGYTGPGGKYQPAGIVHRGEIVWSQADIARAGGVDTVEALRKGLSAPATIPLPMPLPLPSFPLLNQTDQSQVMRDLLNENKQLRKDLSARLDKIEKHSAAAVQVQQAGFSGQINEQKKGNAALEDMSAAARLEAAR